MQLKTSEFQALFNDGLNGLAGEVPAVVTLSVMLVSGSLFENESVLSNSKSLI